MNPSGIFSSWPIHTLYFLNLVDKEFFEEAFITKKDKVIDCFCDNYIDTNNKADGVNHLLCAKLVLQDNFSEINIKRSGVIEVEN
jgi:hypothetical protein